MQTDRIKLWLAAKMLPETHTIIGKNTLHALRNTIRNLIKENI